MQQQFNLPGFEFQSLGKRKVEADFNGGEISSHGGGMLLRELERSLGLVGRFAGCFVDHRNPDLIEHSILDLVSQRVFGLAMGYEDLNDHDELRTDQLFATMVNKSDPTGQNRRRQQDKGCPLVGKSTLNRLELARQDANCKSRYKKIVYDGTKIDELLVRHFLEHYPVKNPKQIVIDLDATDDLIHGNQEGRFFHGYYRHYCSLPLYIFCDDFLLCARLRPSSVGAAHGATDELKTIISMIRTQWPDVRIILRGDSAYSTDEIMTWCEDNNVFYIFGKARNPRLIRLSQKQMEHARRKYLRTGESWRVYNSFQYKTLKSWTRKRLIIAKSEHLRKGPNPRFIVTNLPKSFATTKNLYEKYYCARGDMENRIKEQQLDLFADRTSSQTMRANQLRLWFSSIAYMLIAHLRRVGLRGTKMARAQAGTIRNKLFKIGAIIKISCRRVYIAFSQAFPYKEIFARVHQNLQKMPVFT